MTTEREPPDDKALAYVIDAVGADGRTEHLAVHQRDVVPFDMGMGDSRFETIDLADGGTINIVYLYPGDDLTIEVAGRSKGSWINGMIALKGHASFTFPNGEEALLGPALGCGFQHRGDTASFNIPGGQELVTFGLTISEATYKRYLGDDVPPSLMRLLDPDEAHKIIPFTVSHNMHSAVAAAIEPGLSGRLRQFQIQGAALIFFAYLASAIDKRYSPVTTSLSANDRLAAGKAYDILRERIADPPMLSELALNVGLTEYRLNQAFQEIHGSTVFEALRRLRLEQARDMVVRGDMAIKEIAFAVGYGHVSNFSSAFSAYFGMPPATYAKKTLAGRR